MIVTYPGIRHVLPDRVSLDADTDARVLETVARFIERQQWLVSAVVME